MGKVLDSWSGRTGVFDGRRHFEHNGVWRPDHAISNPGLGERLRRWLRPQVVFRSSRDRAFVAHPERGGYQAWEEPLDAIISDGTQISNTTTETIVCPDYNFPANYFAPGRVIRIYAWGVNSNVVTTPGTLIVRVRWGGVAGVVLVASAAQGLDTTARTNAMWFLDTIVVCRAQGSSGTFLSGGRLAQHNLLSSTAANLLPALLGSAGAPNANANAGVSVDTTTAKLLSITAQFSVTTNPTNLTCQSRIIEALN
jgi:hypothetical protein